MLSRSVMVAGILAGAMAMSPGAVSHAVPRVQANVSAKKKRGLFNGAVLPSGDPLIGFRQSRRTVAMAKREALKKRNKIRHRARGRK